MIEKHLDKNGWGKLSEELQKIFLAAGCDPACHICGKKIAVGDRFHLKEFFRRKRPNGMETTAQAMLCSRCSKNRRKLSRSSAFTLANLAGKSGTDGNQLSEYELKGAVERPLKERTYRSTQPRGLHHGCFLINGQIVTKD